MVNMALSQLLWDVLMPWNLKSTYFSLKMIHFLSLNIWYVIYVVFWIKYWNLKRPHHCILFLFTICTVSQLFWNRVCISVTVFSLNFYFDRLLWRPLYLFACMMIVFLKRNGKMLMKWFSEQSMCIVNETARLCKFIHTEKCRTYRIHI